MRFFILRRDMPTAAAATLLISMCAARVSAAVDVTALHTSSVQGATSRQTVAGCGDALHYPSSQNYHMTWKGEVERIDSLRTDTGIYAASDMASTFIRRSEGKGDDILWYKADTATDRRRIDMDSQATGNTQDAFGTRNLLVGSDNLFANRGDPTGNVSNVERVDFIFRNGLLTSDSRGFSIFDRGISREHDGFNIVAITALDDAGAPSAYGDALAFENGSWGNIDLVEDSAYLVVRRDRLKASNLFRPSNLRTQSIGGVFIPTTDLAPAGNSIYGYSLLAPDTMGSGAELLDWQDASHYPQTTLNDHHVLAGGLDPIGLSAVLFTSVPEPTSMLALLSAGLLLRRKRPSTKISEA
ncbi:MAG: PEP-CTERM sorting domain-containing protein [Pseudomonadota bacterium]|nr:PEP-CTERM sorting domain-containing protein [Pseudomonadota bacterium]